MIRTGSMKQQPIINKTSAVNTEDELSLKFLECIPCPPDSALKSFSPYACDMESIGACSDESDFEGDDEVSMPPPSPFNPRGSNGLNTDAYKLGVMSTLSRPRSASPKRDGGMPKGRGMQRIISLPNMEYGRASYNRGIGQVLLESVAECDKARGKEDAAKKVAQFDALLEDFE